ncbi:MAG: MogA/MoaB family molybdenum cofactor biosynthesis protein [Methanomassiliicoccales archaeon]|nr:MogA/MoaB family molybdenum cofactor biosynthesis protein [Methanomassiliicoccales archaeon]
MGYEDHMKHALQSVPCAVITVSDSRTVYTDESGKLIMEKLRLGGHSVVDYKIVKDNLAEIKGAITASLENSEVKVIICNGGTGIAKRDVTVEAVCPFLEKRIEGFGEFFRYLSYEEIGIAAMMSRAIGGVAFGKIILCLPGSSGAVSLAMDKIILPQIGHMVWEVER